jgi:hypothetical protein
MHRPRGCLPVVNSFHRRRSSPIEEAAPAAVTQESNFLLHFYTESSAQRPRPLLTFHTHRIE